MTARPRHSSADDVEPWTKLVDMALHGASVMPLRDYVEIYGTQLDAADESDDEQTTNHANTDIITAAGTQATVVPSAASKQKGELESNLSYQKIKGRSRTIPVKINENKSAVSQLFELASHLGVPNPVMTSESQSISKGPSGLKHYVTLRFLGRTWEDSRGTISVKAGREAVCMLALRDVLGSS